MGQRGKKLKHRDRHLECENLREKKCIKNTGQRKLGHGARWGGGGVELGRAKEQIGRN